MLSATGKMSLTNEQFERSRKLAFEIAGIELFERHREVLERRNGRRGLSGQDLDRLLEAAEQGNEGARDAFVVLVTTKFTGFFRHPRHFQFVVEEAKHAVELRGRVRAWSAATATGEEAFSLAMALSECGNAISSVAEVWGTDIDPEALTFAERGEYGGLAMAALNPGRRDRFFSEVLPGRRWRISLPTRQMVRFSRLNLAAETFRDREPFDLIFCRNVIMYLEPRLRQGVLERLESCLLPGGLLMLDPAENPGTRIGWRKEAPGVYRCNSRSTPRTDGLPEHRNSSDAHTL